MSKLPKKVNTFSWTYKGKVYKSRPTEMCPFCNKFSVVRLPAKIKKEQTDGTTHVCHPSIGGCNHGFEKY